MDKALKQRLVGAAILIALAVIFVPIWVGGPDQREDRGDAIDLPEPRAVDREVRRLPLGESRQPREEPDRSSVERLPDDLPDPEGLPEVAIEPEPAEPEPEPEITEEPPEEASPPSDLDEESVAETGEPAPAEGDWLVQVASFGSAESAADLSNRLEALGYSAVTDTVVRGETRLHRVRAGPFASQSDAELARSRIGGEIAGVQPAVVSIGGAAPAAGTAPAGGRYAVQVGVFAREENATQLRERLTGRGFTAFVDSETGAGRTTWRVRVGPVMERAEAERLRDRLQAEANVEGMIVSHP